jgi:NADPH-dependent 2,4-dienoyl-CoA reductase/sulfur reductase-like enzyme
VVTAGSRTEVALAVIRQACMEDVSARTEAERIVAALDAYDREHGIVRTPDYLVSQGGPIVVDTARIEADLRERIAADILAMPWTWEIGSPPDPFVSRAAAAEVARGGMS